MKLFFDEKSDTLYFKIDDSQVVESEEVEPGVVLDFDSKNQVVGVEIRRSGMYNSH